MTKQDIFEELKSYLHREVLRVKDELNRGKEDPRLRILGSNSAENLLALGKNSKPEEALVLAEMEEKNFDQGKVLSSRIYHVLFVDVPYDLPEKMPYQGSEFLLATLSPEVRNLRVGSAWLEVYARDEVTLVSQTIVKKIN